MAGFLQSRDNAFFLSSAHKQSHQLQGVSWAHRKGIYIGVRPHGALQPRKICQDGTSLPSPPRCRLWVPLQLPVLPTVSVHFRAFFSGEPSLCIPKARKVRPAGLPWLWVSACFVSDPMLIVSLCLWKDRQHLGANASCLCITCCGYVWSLCSWVVSKQQEQNQHAVLYILLVFYPIEILLSTCSFHIFTGSTPLFMVLVNQDFSRLAL